MANTLHDPHFCPRCQQVKTEWHYRLRNGRQRRRANCQPCMRERWHEWNNKARHEPQTPSIAAAFMGWREAGAAFQGPRVRYVA